MRGRTRGAGAPKTADLEAAAVRLLARREHSTGELQRKLLEKGYPEAEIAAVVEKLTAKRLLSNDRYAASRVRHRVQAGQGPVRIRAELRQQGVAAEVIEKELADAGVDWAQLARTCKASPVPSISGLQRRPDSRRLGRFRRASGVQRRALLGLTSSDLGAVRRRRCVLRILTDR
jgi:regulatory protein